MSYVVRVWEYPVPRSAGEAEQILGDLDDAPGASQARFLQLGRILTKRYPDWGEADDAPGVWVDSPMAAGCASPIWNIGIVSDYLDTAYPFLCETVARLGMCLYDPQVGMLVQPDRMHWSPAF